MTDVGQGSYASNAPFRAVYYWRGSALATGRYGRSALPPNLGAHQPERSRVYVAKVGGSRPAPMRTLLPFVLLVRFVVVVSMQWRGPFAATPRRPRGDDPRLGQRRPASPAKSRVAIHIWKVGTSCRVPGCTAMTTRACGPARRGTCPGTRRTRIAGGPTVAWVRHETPLTRTPGGSRMAKHAWLVRGRRSPVPHTRRSVRRAPFGNRHHKWVRPAAGSGGRPPRKLSPPSTHGRHDARASRRSGPKPQDAERQAVGSCRHAALLGEGERAKARSSCARSGSGRTAGLRQSSRGREGGVVAPSRL